MLQIFIDEPGALLHACAVPIVPAVGAIVVYQNSEDKIEARRVVWRRIEGSTTNAASRIVIGVQDTESVQ